ncbi:extracellular solute-binding protein [Pseudochelatococcus sp. G4_1912]|uniref:extracellular solute-binding protein n=1 Tax=Pseudochelatococcus sp. G4_1912 TaxID=3114288 RepID=UPI0039C6DAE4
MISVSKMSARLTRVVSALALMACVTSPVLADSTAAPRIRIDFWFGNSGDVAKNVQEQCQRFNESQSEFQIACLSQGSYVATTQNTVAAYRVNKQPTIVQLYDVSTLDIMLSDAFYPVKKLMADEGYSINWDDYLPTIASGYMTSKGELYSIPYNSSTTLLYWNKDAFKKIGRDRAPATWEEADTAFRELKAAGYQCPFAINISADESFQLMEQFSTIHNQPVSTKSNGYDGLGAELVVDKTLFARFVGDLKRWYDEGLLRIKSKETGQDMASAFTSGECQATLISVGQHGVVGSTAPKGMNWDVALYPVYEGHKRNKSLAGGASLWVLNGKTPDEYRGASAFLKFISSPEETMKWSQATGYIPVTKSSIDYMVGKGFYEQPGIKGRELAIESVEFSSPSAFTRGMRLGTLQQIRMEFSNAMQAIFSNKLSVEDGLKQLVKRGNMSLRRYEATYKGQALP